MKIDKFWVVTKPTSVSTVKDISFECTPETIGLQFLGGLKIEDVVAFYACQHESDNIARGLIDELVYHEKDDDCKLDNPDGLPGTCVECGVYHDEPCPDCGGTGFHKDGCQEIE